MANDLKLFVWKDVLCDCTCGGVCVLAHNFKEAIELINKKWGENSFESIEALRNKYEIITDPEAFCFYGGG